MLALRVLRVLLILALGGLASLSVSAHDNPSGVDSLHRHEGQSARDFALKAAPPDELLSAEKVVFRELNVMDYELKLVPDGPKAIVAIYRQIYRKTPDDTINEFHHTRVYAYLPVGSGFFHRVLVKDFDLNSATLGPEVESVFLINKVGGAAKNLAVISSYYRMHNGVGGHYFDVSLYDTASNKIREGHLRRIDNLSDKLSGCDCQFDYEDSDTTSFESAKYKTASQVKTALRKMGYSD